ncbi:MAG: MerR family transcriptional regulator [Rectinemataceae bacterium]
MKDRDGNYKIGDLAAMFGLTVRTVRYYEELSLLKSSDRSEGLHRRYPEKNIVYLKRIAQLKSYGLSLGEIKEFFSLASQDRSGEACRRLLIRKYGERIEDEERIAREAEARLKDLRWHVRQLETVENFFECPGRQCGTCDFGEWCEMKLGGGTDNTSGTNSEEER